MLTLLHTHSTIYAALKTTKIIMCLNLPFEVKNRLIFSKMRWCKYTFWYIRCLKNFWGSANILLQIPPKMGKMKKSSAYSLKLKNIILFLNRGLFFFSNGHNHNVFRWYQKLWKSTLKMATLFRHCVTLFNSTLKYKALFVSTLLSVANYNVDVHNVVSTLIWCYATSRRHINLKTRLNRRWNVCWVHFWLKLIHML